MPTQTQEQTQEQRSDQNSQGFINNELALGDDRDFERVWWRIEIGVWIFLVAVLILALTGLLGHGPLGHKELSSSDKALEIRYERIAHYKTPAILQVRVHPQLFQEGKAYLHLSRVTVHGMGAQRISPQPEKSMPDDDGISYLFPPKTPANPSSSCSPSSPPKPECSIKRSAPTPTTSSSSTPSSFPEVSPWPASFAQSSLTGFSS